MNSKKFVPCIYLKEQKIMGGFRSKKVLSQDPVGYCVNLLGAGADELLIFDLSSSDSEHDANISIIREINRNIDIPALAAGNIKRLEDVKKLIYAGCRFVALNMAKQSNIDLLTQASARFGKEKLMACVDASEQLLSNADALHECVSGIVLLNHAIDDVYSQFSILPMVNEDNQEMVIELLQNDCVYGITGDFVNLKAGELMEFKHVCKEQGVSVNTFESSLSFADFKKNADGHVCVVVQDYKTDEVLMSAYMNEEAFINTVRTGKMTYYSRSRKELWVKGETSGHYQYVRKLYADCDRDTILAKVMQVGAACHTGNRSCFYTEILSKDYQDTNPLRVFESVYNVIMDRKEHPKEGSYTNYLFDKGIDKILKKVGEEATEIVIAAKNPDKEEVKYEIADFLYHVMVLMAECDLTWEDITKELANR